jgi:exodeoxyribonuclease VII small subunit
VSKKAKLPGFEAALTELEKLVAQMETGELSLEDSLQQFERGVQLTRACQADLQKAQQKVEILLQRPAGAVIAPLDAAGANTEELP